MGLVFERSNTYREGVLPLEEVPRFYPDGIVIVYGVDSGSHKREILERMAGSLEIVVDAQRHEQLALPVFITTAEPNYIDERRVNRLLAHSPMSIAQIKADQLRVAFGVDGDSVRSQKQLYGSLVGRATEKNYNPSPENNDRIATNMPNMYVIHATSDVLIDLCHPVSGEWCTAFKPDDMGCVNDTVDLLIANYGGYLVVSSMMKKDIVHRARARIGVAVRALFGPGVVPLQRRFSTEIKSHFDYSPFASIDELEGYYRGMSYDEMMIPNGGLYFADGLFGRISNPSNTVLENEWSSKQRIQERLQGGLLEIFDVAGHLVSEEMLAKTPRGRPSHITSEAMAKVGCKLTPGRWQEIHSIQERATLRFPDGFAEICVSFLLHSGVHMGVN